MKVLLATPCHAGSVMDNYFRSTLVFNGDAIVRGIQLDVLTLNGESLITRARNTALATFMEGDWTDLLFVDGDIGYEPENAWRLLESSHAVAATAYPLKKIDWEAVSVAQTEEAAREYSVASVINFAPGAQVGEDGFVPVLDAGTGFMRIHRSAVDAMVTAYPDLAYTAEGGGDRVGLFDTMLEDLPDGSRRYLSEDYAFCRRWQQLGGTVMVDTQGPRLNHRGIYEYGA